MLSWGTALPIEALPEEFTSIQKYSSELNQGSCVAKVHPAFRISHSWAIDLKPSLPTAVELVCLQEASLITELVEEIHFYSKAFFQG